jgi:glycosyltransferase involved in cell wall biosynthesis
MSRVSVIIPCYNGAEFLPQALDSVRRQTRPADELIVVDDQSTDDSVSIARRFAARVVQTGRNLGGAGARAVGIGAATGDILAFLDADDYWEPDHIEQVVGLLDRYPEAAVAFSRERRVGEWQGEHPKVLPENRPVDAFWALLRQNLIPQMGVAVRREALAEVGGYDPSLRYSEDYDLWLRLARRHPFVCTHAVTCNHRGHGGQLSRKGAVLARSATEVRHRAWVAARETESLAFVTRVERELQRRWEHQLRTAWWGLDWDRFQTVLGLQEIVPGSAAIHTLWTRRARRWWPWYLRASRIWERLPAGVKEILRWPLRAVLGAP